MRSRASAVRAAGFPSWLLLTVLASCSRGETARLSTATVRDSAGIEIVEHPAEFELALPEWTANTLVVDIGASNDPGHDLDQVRGAVRLSDGRIVVANNGSRELRFYDGSGGYLSAAGRSGNGPGDFASLVMLERLTADTVGALDSQLMRFSFFAPSGTFVRSVSVMHRSEQGYLAVVGPLSDGRLLGTLYPYDEMPKETSGPVRRNRFAVGVIAADGTGFDTVAVVPGYEAFPAIGREGGHEFPALHSLEFGRTSVLVTDGARIYIGTNEPGGIQVYHNTGHLARLIRSLTPPEPVTEENRQQRRRETLAGFERARASEQIKAEWRKNAEDARYAEVFPDYERLLIGTDGSLWQERARRTADEGRRYIVYDTSGKAMATVKSPERFRPYQAGPDEIIGLWRDADDVHHVRVYKISRER